MILDVGCGNHPKGDVNCDLYIDDTEGHRNSEQVLSNVYTLNVHAIPNFVKCSSLYLPFKEGTFETVISSQVIEHVENPFAMLKELAYVATKRIEIETVHRVGEAFDLRGRKWYRKHHVSKFNFHWFFRAAQAIHWRVTGTKTINCCYFPNSIMRILTFPLEISVIMENQND